MTRRVIFTDPERSCLQELVNKYLQNPANANQSLYEKKKAWTDLSLEFNSFELNGRRSEAQLRKCWDNMKSRQKSLSSHEKRERKTSRERQYNSNSGASKVELMFLDDDDPMNIQTDVKYDLNSDNSVTSEEPKRSSSADEFTHKKEIYKRQQSTDGDLNQLIMAEKRWLVKAAEENYKRAKLQRQSAEEELRTSRALREKAELELSLFIKSS